MEGIEMDDQPGREAAEQLTSSLGRRRFLQVVSAFGAVGLGSAAAGCGGSGQTGGASRTSPPISYTGTILQPGAGSPESDHYLTSKPDEVLWGYVPTVHARPVLQVRSGQTVTVDTVSHEGIMEDQGRDPVAYFGLQGVPREQVLEDVIDIAAHYRRTPRNFDVDGPHVVTGPIFVEGAQRGDVLKIEPLQIAPRVPYGVVSSRHGKGALAPGADGRPGAGITLEEVMPPAGTDGRSTRDPMRYGNVSTFTRVEGGSGVMSFGGSKEVRFPLRPFLGMMGVAFSEDPGLTSPSANSIPPTLGGGNIDIRLLGAGSAFYVPVFADGALFYVGDPHMAMGDGEVALTAMEGSLRTTLRLTVCKPGSGDAPSVAFGYPFGETPESWVPIGLSDPDGSLGGGNITDLNIAMRRAVVNALDFLERDRGMDRATGYAYLSAASDFVVSQVVDRTVGVHGQIYKSHFR